VIGAHYETLAMSVIEEAQMFRLNGYLQHERRAGISVVAGVCRQMSLRMDVGITHRLRHRACEIEG
jgi:hypothetical protein